MEIPFWKYSGCGNDFIIFDNREDVFPSDDRQYIERLCHRHWGIGADGVILLETSLTADFKMVVFNADGCRTSMCGNGLRCLMAFIHDQELASIICTIETESFVHQLQLNDDATITATMPPPHQQRWHQLLTLNNQQLEIHALNTGVPHAILFVNDIATVDMNKLGSAIRHHHDFYPHGTNANIAHINDNNIIDLRTYERGVEAETWACGTGATATAIAAAIVKHLPSPIKVRVRSGDLLTIAFDVSNHHISNISMTGPANRIFQGTMG